MLGVFRYVHITPYLITLTIILKLLYGHTCNPLGFFPVKFPWELVFRHKDDLSKIIIQGAFIELVTTVTLKVFIKTLDFLWWIDSYCNQCIEVLCYTPLYNPKSFLLQRVNSSSSGRY